MNTISIRLLVLSAIVALTVGCTGPRGPAGPPGSNRVIQTINCLGTISGLAGGASVLNGLDVEYEGIVMEAGDVYATAAVIDENEQTSGTSFYAAGQSGSSTAEVVITKDYHNTDDFAEWSIKLNRSSYVTSIVYDDPSLGAPVVMSFTAAACTVQNW
jgi:hypothetical protein